MIRFPRKIKNYNVFIDGVGYAGLSSSATPPNIVLSTERHRGAGMDGGSPIDMGIEDMTSAVVMAQWMPELITRIGRRERFTLRPTEMSDAGDFDAQAFIMTVGGLWAGNEFGELSPGAADANHTLACEVNYLRMVYEGRQLCRIDIEGGIREIGEVDQLAAMRREMGY